MLERTEYVCEFCQTAYKNEENARECEENHKTIVSVKEAKYNSKKSDNSGKPSRILVEFSDGTTEWYKR